MYITKILFIGVKPSAADSSDWQEIYHKYHD